MSTIIQSIEQRQLRHDVPLFKAGDTVRVHFRVIEGTRSRIQVFEGVVIKRQGSGARETFTVRKQSFGVGVERTFPVHSPKIEKIEVAAIGDVNRAKLYYLRGKVGKKARIRELRPGAGSTKLAKAQAAHEKAQAAALAEAAAPVVVDEATVVEAPVEETPVEEAAPVEETAVVEETAPEAESAPENENETEAVAEDAPADEPGEDAPSA